MKKSTSIFCSILLISFCILLFQNTSIVLNSVVTGIDLWKNNIFPALFPFFIISHIMIDFGFVELLKEILKPIMAIFKINPNASFILAMALMSGSPSNAIYTKELYTRGLLNKTEAEKALTFTYFSSPLFILGTVSLIYLKNKEIGILVFFSHILSNFLVGLIFRNYGAKTRKEKMNLRQGFQKMYEIQKSVKFTKSITKSIEKGISTMFLILGSVSFIYIITACLTPYFPENEYITSTLKGILEVTQGLKSIADTSFDLYHKGLLSSMILSFGGISIYIQIISILSDTDLSTLPFFIARLLQAAFSGILFMIFFYFTT